MSLDTLVILLMAAGTVIFIGEPLVRRRPLPGLVRDTDHELERLSLHKETLYTAIRDLDFDFQTGKVDHKDYTLLRQHLETEALQVLRQIDNADPLAGLDRELERQILAIRQQSPSTTGLSPKSCPGCGATLDCSENFCPFCGQAIAAAIKD
jgi:hypothetical protein